MTQSHHSSPSVLRQNLARKSSYGRNTLSYGLTVFKWRFHFYKVLDKIRAASGDHRPPYDFDALADYFDGFKVEYCDINDLPPAFLSEIRAEGEVKEGWNHIDVSEGIIYLFFDPTVSVERQRFTIAHEWGHVLQRLDMDFKADMEAMRSHAERSRIIERVADYIAAYYLAPHNVLRTAYNSELRRFRDTDIVVEQLARRFKVSKPVITISFMNMRPRIQIR